MVTAAAGGVLEWYNIVEGGLKRGPILGVPAQVKRSKSCHASLRVDFRQVTERCVDHSQREQDDDSPFQAKPH